ncbi:MAG: DNA-binding protein [Candidatus Aenigmarchaeota archaeon]|nr:DNA-binding protein [Candidatus Aenigmarchaeota archaeon]
MKVILDTNILMLPEQRKIDVFKYDAIVLEQSVRELKKIAKSRSKHGRAAKVALELIKRPGVKIVDHKKHMTDNAILDYAKLHSCAVATNDKELIKKLKAEKIKIIRMRQMKYLEEC